MICVDYPSEAVPIRECVSPWNRFYCTKFTNHRESQQQLTFEHRISDREIKSSGILRAKLELKILYMNTEIKFSFHLWFFLSMIWLARSVKVVLSFAHIAERGEKNSESLQFSDSLLHLQTKILPHDSVCRQFGFIFRSTYKGFKSCRRG